MKALSDSLQKHKVLYSWKLYDVIIDFVQDPVACIFTSHQIEAYKAVKLTKQLADNSLNFMHSLVVTTVTDLLNTSFCFISLFSIILLRHKSTAIPILESQVAQLIVVSVLYKEQCTGVVFKTLEAVFRRLHETGLTINKSKCLFNQTTIELFGLVFSSDGVSPDPSKVTAIKHATKPNDVAEIKSFLGMTSYCSRFIKDYKTISEPLRRLTKTNTPWCWSDKQETAFLSLKDSLTSNLGMRYFDPQKNFTIIVDASPIGLGRILTQDNHVLGYASRSLTEVESQYSQTEREALAIVWACKHFDMYTNGAQHFTVITNHKPLENIWQKTNPTPRIQRWGLRLQPYKFTISYQPSSSNPSDYLSRHPEPNDQTRSMKSLQERVAERYVNFLAITSTPQSMSLDDIKNETQKDQTMQKSYVIGSFIPLA